MNANELADELKKMFVGEEYDRLVHEIPDLLRQQQEQIDKLTAIVALRELKIERMIEDRSKYEAMAHVGGVEAGKELVQAEIEALKQIIDANNLNQNIGQFVKPTNEPVAWMLADKEAEHIRSIMAVQHDFVPKGCVEIPLYTHPVKALTDEEIRHIQAICHLKDVGYDNFIMRFAKAILRKARE